MLSYVISFYCVIWRLPEMYSVSICFFRCVICSSIGCVIPNYVIRGRIKIDTDYIILKLVFFYSETLNTGFISLNSHNIASIITLNNGIFFTNKMHAFIYNYVLFINSVFNNYCISFIRNLESFCNRRIGQSFSYGDLPRKGSHLEASEEN